MVQDRDIVTVEFVGTLSNGGIASDPERPLATLK